MENSNKTLKSLLYTSKNYVYQPIIISKIYAKPQNSDAVLLLETESQPAVVEIFDHEEYVQFDVIHNADAEGNKSAQHFIDGLSTASIRAKYPNYAVYVTITLIPNPLSRNVYLFTDSFESIYIWTDEESNQTITSFCSATKYTHIATDNTSTMNYKNIANIVEYGVISESERRLIDALVTRQNQLNFQHGKFDKQKKFFNKIFGTKKSDKKQDSQHASLIESLHMTEQEAKIFDPDMLSVSIGEANPEAALENLIGLENVKEEVKKLKAKLRYRKRQKDRKIYVSNAASMHMCFTGSPGTGKTTVARIIAGILYNMGYIKENKCVEVNGQNLKGGYTGQTAIITKLVMKSAKNKVLFIDEAYALFDDYENGYGKEAVAVILKEMEDERDNTIVIFAGYKNDMEQFLLMNDGLKSRINRYIDFHNYTCEELAQILMSSLAKKKLYITEDALAKCILAFKKAETSERFSNGRFVRNMLEKIEYEHAYNTHSTKNTQRQDTITIEDVSDELINELLTRSM